MSRASIQPRGISHVSLAVSDLKHARVFYEGVLGLVPIRRPKGLEHPGHWYFIGQQELHLMQAHDTDINPIQHVAIEVADIRATKALLHARGVRVIGDLRAGVGGFQSIYCYDPDGNRIELCQPVGFPGLTGRDR
jgi:catechol 2,3-dioxygenase-like lactoylglutathione lyase family enzyme